jgi:hypothetical protein
MGHHRIATAVLVALLLLTSCRGIAQSTSVQGVVVAVNSSSMVSVNNFRLREADGTTLTFVIGPLDADSFPAEHLQTHLQSAIPIVVTYQQSGGENVALHLVDAPIPSPAHT